MNKYVLGPDVPPEEPVYDSRGQLIDDDYVQRAVDDVHRALGRPSLSGQRGSSSPRVSFRLPAAEREQAQKIAEQEGKTVSQLAREAPGTLPLRTSQRMIDHRPQK